jgi:REP element-mobilizing transposase RayT
VFDEIVEANLALSLKRPAIEGLRIVRQRYPFSLYAYVLMSNHFHLLLEVDRFPTARILQSLLTGYVRRFNKIHRYDVKIIETEFYG